MTGLTFAGRRVFRPWAVRGRLQSTAGAAALVTDLGARMSLEQDVAAARRAVDALEQACGPVARHFGDTVDARRLRVDVARLRDDLTLLCGNRPVYAGEPRYAAVGYDDGWDEGVAAPGRVAP